MKNGNLKLSPPPTVEWVDNGPVIEIPIAMIGVLVVLLFVAVVI